MNPKPVPYKHILFVCTNEREPGRPACGQRGSEAICEKLKEEVKKQGLKGKVRVARSGCMDLCEQGPNVMVFPENAWYSGVTLDDVPALVEKYLKKDQ